MLKNAYGKNIYLEQVCLNGTEGSEKGSENRNEKTEGESDVYCIFLC
jgi:hypothetical protein